MFLKNSECWRAPTVLASTLPWPDASTTYLARISRSLASLSLQRTPTTRSPSVMADVTCQRSRTSTPFRAAFRRRISSNFARSTWLCEVGRAVLQYLMVSEVEVPRGDTTTPAELATALDGEVGRGQLIEYAGQLADPMDRCRKKRFPNLVSGKGLALE